MVLDWLELENMTETSEYKTKLKGSYNTLLPLYRHAIYTMSKYKNISLRLLVIRKSDE